MEGYHVCRFHLEDKDGVEQGILTWSRGGNVLFLKLLSTFPSSSDTSREGCLQSCLIPNHGDF
jgi:hypothetical protein